MTTLHPRLIVADPNAAIVSYEEALSATLFERFVDGEGRVVHAAMAVGDGTFSLAQTVPEWDCSISSRLAVRRAWSISMSMTRMLSPRRWYVRAVQSWCPSPTSAMGKA